MNQTFKLIADVREILPVRKKTVKSDNEGATEKTSNSKSYNLYFSAIKFCFQTF